MLRTILLLTVLLAGLVTIALQRKALAAARAEQMALLAEREESERLNAENQELSTLRAGVRASGTANPDLLRLRNEVRQLRALAQEVERLRAANQRRAQEVSATARPLSEQEGYVAKEQWAESGFATPEATVQTLFRAARDRDVTRLLQCVTPEAARAMGLLFDSKTGQLHPSAEETLRVFGLMQGFRVEQRTEVAPNEVALEVRAVTAGDTLRLRLFKQGEEWKLAGI